MKEGKRGQGETGSGTVILSLPERESKGGNGVRNRYFVAAGARVQVTGWRIPLSAQKRVVGLRHEQGETGRRRGDDLARAERPLQIIAGGKRRPLSDVSPLRGKKRPAGQSGEAGGGLAVVERARAPVRK